MVRATPTLPEGHGQVVEQPEYGQWATLAARNRDLASTWDFAVAKVSAAEMRSLARRDLLGVGSSFSARLGVAVREAGDPDGLIIVTGHQPQLYHTGVWVKDFLLERFARENGASAVDLVVDTDGFDAVAVSAPCMTPGVRRCRQYLALGTPATSFATQKVPSTRDIAEFCSAADAMLASLPAPAVRRHFSAFCACLRSAADDAGNLAELLTIARRRYEASAGTSYMEAPLTMLSATESFLRFVVHVALDAEGFVSAYNAELGEYRTLTKTRSAAQPFPDLRVEGGRFELPLWHLGDGGRRSVWAEPGPSGTARIVSGEQTLAELSADPDAAVATLRDARVPVAPKAAALTLFVRMFACDLFIHGVGGGRYDQVTDGIVRRYFVAEPPAFVVASMTMYLPVGARLVTAEDVAAAKERLNRLEHNPDAFLGEVVFEDSDERAVAYALAAEKRTAVDEIERPDADKKALGMRIREVNRALGEVLSPLKAVYAAEVKALEEQARASEVLTDRSYPYCFWDPSEIADKVW